MPNRIISSRLAAHANTRQVDVAQKTDAAASAVDRAIGGVWQDFLRFVKSLESRRHTHGEVYERAGRIFNRLLPEATAAVDRHLVHISVSSYQKGARHTAGELPTDFLATAVISRIRNGHATSIKRLREGSAEGTRLLGTQSEGMVCDGDSGDVLSDRSSDYPGNQHLLEERDPAKPGVIRLALDAIGHLTATDLAAPLRPPGNVTDGQGRELFKKLLFPPPPEQLVRRWLHTTLQSQTWYDALDSNARRAQFGPLHLARVIAGGYSAGQTQQEIAKSVLPFVDGMRYRARRTARTFGLAVAQAAQQSMHDQLGDLVVAYQVHALLDQNTRPRHRHRNGTIYYLHPVAGQIGMDQCPHPPLEADGSLAWNCRCTLSPVLAPPAWAKELPGSRRFGRGESHLYPDPTVYSDWFARASEKSRRLAVGSRRYAAVVDRGDARPRWEHFIDPANGDLLPVESIRTETAEVRQERLAKVRQVMDERRQLLSQVLSTGFAPSNPSMLPMPAA